MNNKILILISAAVAVIFWLYVFTRENTEFSLEIPISIVNAQPGTVVNITPATANMKILTPKALLKQAAESARIVIDCTQYGKGSHEITIATGDVSAPGFEVIDVFPKSLKLDIHPTVKKSVRVQPVIVDSPANGYKVSSIKATPARVEVEGLQEILANLDAVNTEFISLSTFISEQNLTVKINKTDDLIRVTPEDVKITVSILPDVIVKEYQVSVQCLPDTGEPSEQPEAIFVTLNISGRRDLVEDLPPYTAYAFADCDAIAAGKRTKVIPAEIEDIKIWGIAPEFIEPILNYGE
jgi:YbbR domain-containing protein